MADTLYKKREGLLALSKNQRTLSWTPKAPENAPPELTVLVMNITNLQQTPPDKAKVMLKLFAQSDKSIEPLVHIFTFSSPTQARTQADDLKDSLSKAISAAKSPSNGDVMVQPAVTTKPGADAGVMFTDDQLANSIELQKSLLQANQALLKTFMESLKTKPAAISNAQFTTQFWSSRLNLLRVHAVEQAQSKGSYNVLSTIKPRTEDNTIKLNIRREEINLIFSQHPLLRQVYDENVPKLSEADFWTRFFQSRLLKKFKGERVTDADSKDSIFDKYLDRKDEEPQNKRLESHIPQIINIQGNEENHSQRQGNAPDLLMRPTSLDRVPIIRTLNSLSERLMAQVAPSDIDPSQPIGMDEETFNTLALRDLQAETTESRIVLNVKDQRHFFSSDKDSQPTLTPQQLLARLKTSNQTKSTHDLTPWLKLNPESDGDSDEPHLSEAVMDRVSLTHATTTEFLHYFWSTFLSGDPSRSEELASLVETLKRALQRIEAVATDAETERADEIEKQKKHAAERARRLGRVPGPIDESAVKGGKKAVDRLFEPTLGAIRKALEKYEEATITS